ncbi:tetratricopeptide repeat protein [Oscillatoriales cyanobacterium LEGE 11467]|uniref:Tetratricopeptide repeat protein n=1 Tax=Zarconia navalis LEGE 11467 TaxID=1828826 RepID=A0A928Z7Q2_9CYAN|nr:tetratricopeptide repeat protein [Zarconia navalis]MBE9039699.1 tetratricopeptide repeat protein [Zarconia navalis LEGE 11467]
MTEQLTARMKDWLSQQPPLESMAMQGQRWLENSRFKLQKTYYQNSIRVWPDRVKSYDKLGKLFRKQGCVGEAIQTYKQVLEIDPKCLTAYNALGDIFRDRQEYDEAIATYRQGLECAPQAAWLHQKVACLCVTQKRWEEAAVAYRKAIEISPKLARWHHQFGDVLVELKQWHEAAEVYRNALNRDPDFFWTHHNLACVLTQLERWDEAIESYQNAVELDSQSFWSYHELAGLLVRQNRQPEAAEAYLKTIEINPNFDWWYHASFWPTLVKQNQLDRAVELFDRVIKNNPDLVEAYINLGDGLTRQKNLDRAISCFQIASDRQTQIDYPDLVRAKQDDRLLDSPNFVIIGASKSGTTSLYSYMVQHPKILPAIRKEINYWSGRYKPRVDWYLSHFFAIPENQPYITGEASPSYIYVPQAAERMHSVFPNMKSIVLLRNPVDRAISHYHHWVRRGIEHRSLEDATVGEIEAFEAGKIPERKFAHYIAHGRYFRYLKPWFEKFGLDNILILKTEDFYQYPDETLTRVYKFLDIPEHHLPEYPKYNSGSYSPIDPKIRQRIAQFYQPSKQRLEAYLGVDFNWD